MTPLALRLKKQAHRDIAAAQDIITQVMYEKTKGAVIHGGTAIWRCFRGNRFSEDIDVYIPSQELDAFFRTLVERGFSIDKKKITKTSVYSSLVFQRTVVRFEALFKRVQGSLKEYETADGNFISVYTLMAEELVCEKINTYMKRLKVRDLYDIFFLLRHIINRSIVEASIKKLLRAYVPPVDEKELRVLIIEGLVPDVHSMRMYIERW